MRPWAVVPILLAAASLARAQSPVSQAPPAWHLAASVVASSNTAGPDSGPCDNPQGQLGDFCGSAGGNGPGVLLAVGRTIAARASVEFEAALGTTRSGSATLYRYAGHFATDQTDATYTHREQLFSVLFRFHAGDRGRRGGVEPVVGATLARGTDALTRQVETLVDSSVSFRLTRRPSDISTSRWAMGVATGADILVARHRRMALLGTARLRFIGWRSAGPEGAPGPVPVGVGRLAVQVGAGLRWGGVR